MAQYAEMVTTIAGRVRSIPCDGPASRARFYSPFAIAVAPNGALFVNDVASQSVRRISAAKWPAAGGPPAERMVTTLIGAADREVQFARSSAKSFRERIRLPASVLFTPPANGRRIIDIDRDVGCLYVSSEDRVHAFDMAEGERKCFDFVAPQNVTGLALTEDGARLFVVTCHTVSVFDTCTGAGAVLVSAPPGTIRAGPVTSDEQTTGRFGYAMGCVLIDRATRSLVMCDANGRLVAQLRGVDV